MRTWIIGAVIAAMFAVPVLAANIPDLKNPTFVMIVGVFHMSNPKTNLHNTEIPDVLAPKYQIEFETIVKNLDRFHPTAVAVEAAPGTVDTKYASYLAGTLNPSRHEYVQLGFRLAKKAGVQSVLGIDHMAAFPYQPVEDYAKAHGQSDLLTYANDQVAATLRHWEGMVQKDGLRATLRSINDPAELANFNDFYPLMLRVGGGDDQPGAALLQAWYGRNFRICANLIQQARPGDHIVVFYGAGHEFLLRQCIAQSPGFKLVEPNDFL